MQSARHVTMRAEHFGGQRHVPFIRRKWPLFLFSFNSGWTLASPKCAAEILTKRRVLALS